MEDNQAAGVSHHSSKITRFYKYVEEFSKLNMLQALLLTINMWNVDQPTLICVRLFRQVFDVDGWYAALELDDKVHNLANSEFYYTMMIIDVFVYKNFRRVPRLLEYVELSGHHLSNYVYSICMMLNPENEEVLKGLNRFKGMVGTGDGLSAMEWWRQKFCKDIYKICQGIFQPSYSSLSLCRQHPRITHFEERAVICYECCADHELRVYTRHFEFIKALEHA